MSAFVFGGETVSTREDAVRVACMIAGGRLSRLYNFAIEYSTPETRVAALAASAQADAADVAMLCSLAGVLPEAVA